MNNITIEIGNINIIASLGRIPINANNIAIMFPTHLSTLYFPLKLLKYSFIAIIATIDIDIFTTVVFPSISIKAKIATNIKPDKIRLIFIIFSPHLGVRQIFYFFFDILLLLLLNLLFQILANVYLENKTLNM